MSKKYYSSYDDWKLSEPPSYNNEYCLYCDSQEIDDIAEKHTENIFIPIEQIKNKIQQNIELLHQYLQGLELNSDTSINNSINEILEYNENIENLIDLAKEKKLNVYLTDIKKCYSLCKQCFLDDQL